MGKGGSNQASLQVSDRRKGSRTKGSRDKNVGDAWRRRSYARTEDKTAEIAYLKPSQAKTMKSLFSSSSSWSSPQ